MASALEKRTDHTNYTELWDKQAEKIKTSLS
jgi:hypothetical protein